MKPTVITPELHAQIKARRAEGAGFKQISREFHLSTKRASELCTGIVKKHVVFRGDGLPHKILTHLEKAGGVMSFPAAAQHFGVSVKYVYDTVARMAESGELERVHGFRLPEREGGA